MKKVAIVTGASRGIGAATAKLLAANDYHVCINYRQEKARAQTIVNEILQKQGHAIAVQADLSKESDILRLFETVDKELGTVTALVNNAGINGGTREVENMTLETLQNVFSTNVFGTFLACREAIKRMKSHDQGSIVNISSQAAKFGGTNITHYAASKAAIDTLTLGLAREAANHHIRVNTVSPGVIDTEIHQSASPERLATLLNSLPMKRMGSAKEVAELVMWLLSEKASYVSGAIIPITGSR